MKECFKIFLSQLSKTNTTLDSLTDFKKVSDNVNNISLKLCQLNHLLGRDDLEVAIGEIFEENPKSFSVLGILVAVRDNKMVLTSSNKIIQLNDLFTTTKGIVEYIKETGLEDVFKSKKITNLVDYVFGIEVGLDTNARKNRGGTIMESTIAKLFKQENIAYRAQVSSSEFDGLQTLGEDLKRFDFVVETKSKIYFIEANYYNGGGSKLNEVARAYTDIAQKINKHPKYEFVWITDGQGWHSAKNKLEEAFNAIPSVYNLHSIKDFILRIMNS